MLKSCAMIQNWASMYVDVDEGHLRPQQFFAEDVVQRIRGKIDIVIGIFGFGGMPPLIIITCLTCRVKTFSKIIGQIVYLDIILFVFQSVTGFGTDCCVQSRETFYEQCHLD